MLFEEGLKQGSGVSLQALVRVTDPDIDAVPAFGEQPSVIGSQFAVEDHFDMLRLEGYTLPPAHDGLNKLALPALTGKSRMRAVGDDCIGRADLSPVSCLETDDPVPPLQQMGHIEIAREGRTCVLSFLQDDVIEDPTVADHRSILLAGQNDVMSLRGDKAKPANRVRLSTDDVGQAKLVQDLAPL